MPRLAIVVVVAAAVALLFGAGIAAGQFGNDYWCGPGGITNFVDPYIAPGFIQFRLRASGNGNYNALFVNVWEVTATQPDSGSRWTWATSNTTPTIVEGVDGVNTATYGLRQPATDHSWTASDQVVSYNYPTYAAVTVQTNMVRDTSLPVSLGSVYFTVTYNVAYWNYNTPMVISYIGDIGNGWLFVPGGVNGASFTAASSNGTVDGLNQLGWSFTAVRLTNWMVQIFLTTLEPIDTATFSTLSTPVLTFVLGTYNGTVNADGSLPAASPSATLSPLPVLSAPACRCIGTKVGGSTATAMDAVEADGSSSSSATTTGSSGSGGATVGIAVLAAVVAVAGAVVLAVAVVALVVVLRANRRLVEYQLRDMRAPELNCAMPAAASPSGIDSDGRK